MVLELLIYAKSAMKNFDQSEASFESHMTTMQWRPLIGRNFSLQIWQIWVNLRPFYPWSFFYPGNI